MADRDNVFFDPGLPDLYYDVQKATLHAPNFRGAGPGYALTFESTGQATYTDAQTFYIGQPSGETTTAATRRVYIPKTALIRAAYLIGYWTTPGSNEAWVANIRVNNTSNTQIASVSQNTSPRIWSNTGLAIAVTQGDYIEIQLVNPTWATNPATGNGWSCSIHLEIV